VAKLLEQRSLATSVLQIDIQLDTVEPGARQMGKRVMQTQAPATQMEDGVRQHQLAPVGADVELDHVDADAQRCVK
jgi:hypothetical protein